MNTTFTNDNKNDITTNIIYICINGLLAIVIGVIKYFDDRKVHRIVKSIELKSNEMNEKMTVLSNPSSQRTNEPYTPSNDGDFTHRSIPINSEYKIIIS